MVKIMKFKEYVKSKQEPRDTYKYWFRVENVNVHCGKTDNLIRREIQHRNSGKYTNHNGKRYYWKNGNCPRRSKNNSISRKEMEILHNCNENWN